MRFRACEALIRGLHRYPNHFPSCICLGGYRLRITMKGVPHTFTEWLFRMPGA